MADIVDINFGEGKQKQGKELVNETREFVDPVEVDKILVRAFARCAAMIECLRGIGKNGIDSARKISEETVRHYDKLKVANEILASMEQDWKEDPAFFNALGKRFLKFTAPRASRDPISVSDPGEDSSNI